MGIATEKRRCVRRRPPPKNEPLGGREVAQAPEDFLYGAAQVEVHVFEHDLPGFDLG